MHESFLQWLLLHWIELTGAITGLLYVLCSVFQNIWVWPFSIASASMYILVFAHESMYANMLLQIYFLAVAIYGWYFWLHGKNGNNSGKVPVQKLDWKTGSWSVGIATILFFGLYLFLRRANSNLPLSDALTSALSILASWLLARKVLENWLVWIVTDLLYVGMFLSQALWLTAILYTVFILLAITGYRTWKTSLNQQPDAL